MKLIVGLGNPGDKYKNNRHNIGFVVVDKLSTQYTVGSTQWEHSNKFFGDYLQYKDIILLKPDTFMNESGRAVSALSRFYKLKSSDIYIIHDDLDIPLGKYKIQLGKGPQVHNGLLSVERELGTELFWNVRIGVENREVRGNKGIPGVVYSLEDFRQDEKDAVVDVVARATSDLLTRLE